ncbi:hypothetical protein C1646_776643 [Rhizophagus diaphanus]|nr:hypothetical protein C1646_776643 [Rhizophagus diaphanus] [Rhizophagus sp. MUCL 43196]
MSQKKKKENNRLKKLRRIKAVKDLYKSKDERITKYEKRPLLKILADKCYHSPEISETDDESDKNKIYIYDYSWRSDELKYLLRDILDKHLSTIQTANLQRNRQYDDELQCLDEHNPPDAPSWSYIAQEDNDLDSFYNYNTKDRTGEEAEKTGKEEVEAVVEGGTNKEAEGEEAEDAYNSNSEMDV